MEFYSWLSSSYVYVCMYQYDCSMETVSIYMLHCTTYICPIITVRTINAMLWHMMLVVVVPVYMSYVYVCMYQYDCSMETVSIYMLHCTTYICPIVTVRTVNAMLWPMMLVVVAPVYMMLKFK
jgi:hypothetical protein